MTPTRQVLFAALILIAGGGAVAVWVPGARPVLDRFGLGDLSRAADAPATGAQPAGRGPGSGGPGNGGPGGGARGGATSVIVRAATSEPTVDQVAAIGDGRAIRSVTLSPQTAGRVTAIAVTPGEKVNEGMAIIELDASVERIALDRANIMTEDAAATAERVARLTASGVVADLQQTAAKLAYRTAQLAQEQAQLDLDRRRVVSPIAGHVGLITPEIGDQLTTASVIAQIDDRSSILVDFRLPERFVNRVAVGDAVSATTLGDDGAPLTGRIHAIDNRIDPASRSFRVQAALANDDDRLRSGMAFSIAMSFPGQDRIAVDPLAVQWNATGAFVWTVRDGKAQSVPVRILQRGAGRVVVDAELIEGEPIVVEGVQTLRAGSPVTLVEEAEPTAAASPSSAPASPAARTPSSNL